MKIYIDQSWKIEDTQKKYCRGGPLCPPYIQSIVIARFVRQLADRTKAIQYLRFLDRHALDEWSGLAMTK